MADKQRSEVEAPPNPRPELTFLPVYTVPSTNSDNDKSMDRR